MHSQLIRVVAAKLLPAREQKYFLLAMPVNLQLTMQVLLQAVVVELPLLLLLATAEAVEVKPQARAVAQQLAERGLPHRLVEVRERRVRVPPARAGGPPGARGVLRVARRYSVGR